MMIKIAKSPSDSWGDIEQDMLGRLGLGDDGAGSEGAEEDHSGNSVADDVVVDQTKEPTPRSGREAWGRWSHEDETVELELTLPEGTRAKELTCEVSKAGVMRVERRGEPLLSGKLALPADRTELAWMVDEQNDGSKLLCIELPMRPIDVSRRAASVDCIFDESLLVNGESCMARGLSGFSGKAL